MNTNRSPHNLQSNFQDYNEGIKILAKVYPAAIFPTSHLRLPLKSRILQDIIEDVTKDSNSELRFWDIEAVLRWYCGSFSYLNACVAGAARIDLNGKRVGTVTQPEAREAAQKAAANRERKRQRAANQGLQVLAVNTALDNAELLASAKNHLKKFEALHDADIEIARLMLVLAIEELKTLDARHAAHYTK